MNRLPEPRPSFFHPAAGAAILAVDWLFFGLEWTVGPASLVVMSLTAAVAAYAAVYSIQTRLRGESPSLARAKAVFGALAAGIPFPVAGTLLGGLILILSGLRAEPLKRR